MKYSLALALAVSLQLATGATASADERRNAAYLEIGGAGVLYSVNYERMVAPQLSVRVGASFFMLNERATSDKIFLELLPLGVQYLFLQGNHKIEVGGGGFVGMAHSGINRVPGETDRVALWAISGTAGYRYQPSGSSLMLRAAFTPLYFPPIVRFTNMTVFPSVAVSAGFRF